LGKGVSIDDQTDEANKDYRRRVPAGLDDHDFGRGPPAESDPETAREDDWASYEAKREAYDSRFDVDEDGEYIGND
jgi:hypothetical protein